MKIEYFEKFEYGCQDAQELLTLYLTCPEDLTFDEQDGLEQHLAHCDSCREDYEGMKLLGEAMIANRDYLRDSGVFGKTQFDEFSYEMSHEETMDQQLQDRLQRTLVRRKRRERKEKIARLKQLAKPISAIAACLVVGFGLLFTVSQFVKSQNGSSPIVSSRQQNPVRIELISGNGTEITPVGQLITAVDGLKALRINGNCQMVLNIGTQLSIEPYNLGCIVKLDQGEIYTEVEHDGKQFVVETSHGRAVITGTTFNIKTDRDKMDLAVVEGSVRFESEKGSVNVKSGHQSSIVSGAIPTKPMICNVTSVSQWAKSQDIYSAPVDMLLNTDISELVELPLTCKPYCDPEDIDFDVWIDQHRAWFEREFPWTKRLQRLLAEDGNEVDTIDLLIESGDLWRFAWPQYSQQRILAEDREVIQEIADQYGVEINHLIVSKSFVQSNQITSIEAFKKWLDAFEKGDGNLIIDSIHAATFLINTRSLAWYAIKDDRIRIEKDEQQILDLLKQQVNAASNSVVIFQQLLMSNRSESVCSVYSYKELMGDLRSNIEVIVSEEEKFPENKKLLGRSY